MRRALFVFFVALLVLTWPVRASVSVVSSASATASLGTPATTAAISTTGATLLIAAIASASNANNISDSASNTWTNLTLRGGGPAVTLNYVVNPTTSGTHTFSTTVFAPCIAVIAFSGTGIYNSQESGTSANASSIQPGSLTPSVDNTLLITGFTTNNNTGVGDASINGGFTKQENAGAVASSNVGCAIAYLAVGAAAATNPTWSEATSAALATAMAVFRQGATPGPSVPMILGLGRYLRPV